METFEHRYAGVRGSEENTRSAGQKCAELTVVFYTDFAKAFDCVPHYELLLKAGQIGIGGVLLKNLYDYLNGRKQFVRVDNMKSKPLPVTSGVPQGSFYLIPTGSNYFAYTSTTCQMPSDLENPLFSRMT